MALLEWRDDFSVGVAAIDFEHRELIDLINELYARVETNSDRETLLDTLGEIYAQIASHFALEEKEMRERKYDQYPEHKTDHEWLLDDLTDMIDDCERGAYTEKQTLSQRLDDWFSLHFRTHDARLHKWML